MWDEYADGFSVFTIRNMLRLLQIKVYLLLSLQSITTRSSKKVTFEFHNHRQRRFLLETLLVETSLTVVMKFVGQEPDMETIKSTIGIVLIFGMGYAALVAF